MKYLPLVWAGLWRSRPRTIFTLASIVVAFVLVGVLAGMDTAFEHALAISRLDRMFVDARTFAEMPISYGEQIARVPGVNLVTPRWGLFGYYQDPKNPIQVIGTDERFFAMRPELALPKERLRVLRQTRAGAVVSSFLANQYGWKVGDKIPVQANNATQKDGSRVWTFDIVGIFDDVDRATGRWFIANYEYIDEARASGNGTVDRFLIRIQDPKRGTAIGRQIDQLFTNSAVPTRTTSERSQTQSGTQALGDASFFTHAIVAAVLFMLLFVTGNTMMQSIQERIPEFAMMKTIGFTDGAVLLFILAESLLLCACAAIVGLFASKLLIASVHTPPYVDVLLQTPWSAMVRGLALALTVAAASALFPVWRVHRLSIIDALAGR